MIDIREMTPEDIQNALVKLAPAERNTIERIADRIVLRVKAKHTGKNPLFFNRSNALELMAKLGVWMVQNKVESTERF
jgi:hypothetical protein